jgi:hypothetical protein
MDDHGERGARAERSRSDAVARRSRSRHDLGPFFAVHSHPPGCGPAAPWRPFRELVDSPGSLRIRVEAVRAALADRAGRQPREIELRVAASVAHLGLVARLLAPPVAAAATGHRLDLPLRELWWQDTLGGPVPLSIPVPGSLPPGYGQYEGPTVLDDVIAPLTAATAGLIPISARVLWGNVASAINGAAGQVAARQPDLARPAWAAAAELFTSPWLSHETRPPGLNFRRSSCCLIYKIAADRARARGVCGDCVLR